MGIRDWFIGRRRSTPKLDESGGIPQMPPLSENDNMLLPEQIDFMKAVLASVDSEILAIQDPRIDDILPLSSQFVPNLLAEFSRNPNLAMIHGWGTAHAWIDVRKLREILATKADQIKDYRSLLLAITEQGYDVKHIKYVKFRSALREFRALRSDNG